MPIRHPAIRLRPESRVYYWGDQEQPGHSHSPRLAHRQPPCRCSCDSALPALEGNQDMPQRKRKVIKGAKRRPSTADRWITIAVVAVLVLVIGGAVTLQLTANPGPTPTAPASAQLSVTRAPAETIQRISADQAKSLVDGGQAVLIDVRSAGSYQAGHAVGAISYPEGEESALFDRLPKDKVLIFYCT